MKLVFLSALSLWLLCSPGISAQKIDLHSLRSIRHYQLEQKLRSADPQRVQSSIVPATVATPSVQLAFVTLAEGHTAAELEAQGVRVLARRGNILIAEVPLAEAERVSTLGCVKAMHLERKVASKMDKARTEGRIDDILFGSPSTGLSQAYTGKGVVAGIVDQGFDPHHINFLYPGGQPRISFLSWLRYNSEGTGMAEDQYDWNSLRNFVTDNDATYHGTHTLGIMAGSYEGNVTVAKPRDPYMPTEDAEYQEVENPYYGVAPEADLAVSCGELSDVFIAYGMEYIISYANYMERPAVINLSLGSTNGPRDYQSPMTRYFDLASDEAIICVSAGNEGDLKIALNKTFTADDHTLKTFIYPYLSKSLEDPSADVIRQGSVEIWSDDGTPFELKAVIYNKKRDYRAAYNMPIAAEDLGTYYCSSSDYMVSSSDIVADPTFVKAFEGYVGVGCKLDETTGRYYGLVDYYIKDNAETNADGNYVLGFEVVGSDGQRVECYGDGASTWMDSCGVEGFDDGSTDGSISDLAVSKRLITVGAYNTRNTWTCLDGMMSSYPDFTPGKVSAFSSYGTLRDGRQLPLVCAPGTTVISSVSWPYARQLPEQTISETFSAKAVEDGRINYWKEEAGTSMSTPFVSGTIALWLEANPNLTPEEVQDIIRRTATVDEAVTEGNPVQWGAGKFNPLEGLKEAIRLAAGVEAIAADGSGLSRLVVTGGDGGRYNLFVGAAKGLDISVYSLDGCRVLTDSYAGTDEATVDLGHLAPGVYIINVNGTHSAKVTVK